MGVVVAAVIAVGAFVAANIGIIATVAKVAWTAYSMLKGPKSIIDDIPSPSYSFDTRTSDNPTNIVALPYGKMKLQGQRIWKGGTSTAKMLVCFGYGEIESITNIKINDTDIADVSGASYNLYYGDGVQTIDTRVDGSTNTERAELVGGLKNKAYIALSFPASEVQNGYVDVKAEIEGRKIKVFTAAETYTTIYSRNPIWILYDVMTSYHGLNKSESLIDIDSFISAANYCDETISGGSVKRYECNYTIDVKLDEWELYRSILACCNGSVIESGGKYYVIMDNVRSVSAAYDLSDFHEYTFKFASLEQKYDMIEVNHRNEDNNYAFNLGIAEISDSEKQNSLNPRKKTIDIFSCPNFNQASRLAWFVLNKAHTANLYLEIEASIKIFHHLPGDVVTITDPIFGFEAKKFEIISIKRKDNIKYSCSLREYNENVYTDTTGSVEPTVNYFSLKDPRIFDSNNESILDEEGEPLYED